MTGTAKTYMRGQVVWALWQTFSRHNQNDPRRQQPPKSFLRRIDKIVELGVPFSTEERPGQAGIDLEYQAVHAFEIGLSLMLQDLGLKQGEVAFLIINCRTEIRECFNRIVESAPSLTGKLLAKNRPNGPSGAVLLGGDPNGIGDPNRSTFADTSAFMTFRTVEIREAFGTEPTAPLVFTPKFHYGVGALMQEMDWLAQSHGDNSRILVELSHLFASLNLHLELAPFPNRRKGRK